MAQPIEYDGLVVEAKDGIRLIAIPTAVLEILKYAEVIQFTRAGQVSRLRVGNFLRSEEMRTIEQAYVEDAGANGETAIATVHPIHSDDHSPTTPPAPEPEAPADPADIPLRVRRDGQWVDTHVTRAQYERYLAEGRIRTEAPEDSEGTEQ